MKSKNFIIHNNDPNAKTDTYYWLAQQTMFPYFLVNPNNQLKTLFTEYISRQANYAAIKTNTKSYMISNETIATIEYIGVGMRESCRILREVFSYSLHHSG